MAPDEEVSLLMGLLKRFIRNDLAELHANDVRVRVIGGREGLAPDIAALLDEAEELTRANRGLTLVVAFNYGGRQEIVEAARRLAARRRRATRSPTPSASNTSRARCRPATFPTPTSSSALPASSGCRISCCGRRPTPNSCFCRSIGRISTAPRSNPRSRNISRANAAMADAG